MLYTLDEEATVIAFVLVLLVVYLVVIGIGLANYIMNALALQKIANRRQVPNPWLAWVPVASSWLIGNIADEYDGRNGMKRKWRVVLLTLSLISIGGILVGYIGLIAWVVKLSMYSDMSYVSPESVMGTIGAVIVPYVVILIAAVVAMAQSFCNAICIYKIFESTVPEKAVKYLLLYLLVPLAGGICLLKCRDKGYSKEIIPVAGYPDYTEMVQKTIPEETDSEE